jgi:hypothetical protein
MSWVAVAVGVGGAAVSAYSANRQSKDAAGAADRVGKIDPRFDALLYGDDKSNAGLLNNAQSWYNANQSGLNPQMLQGLNDQWRTLSDPNLRNGYNNMANMGAGLMNAPIAGNPFTDGRANLLTQQTQMAPGLINSSISNTGPQAIGQQAAVNKPLPVAFGSDTGTTGGLITPGPFTAAPVAPPPAAPAPTAAPAAPVANRPFDLPAYQQEFWTAQANNTLTPEQIAEYNNLMGRNAG